jgi:hypothetical protein
LAPARHDDYDRALRNRIAEVRRNDDLVSQIDVGVGDGIGDVASPNRDGDDVARVDDRDFFYGRLGDADAAERE